MADRKRVTVPSLQQKKAAGEKITMLTAYDYPTARMVDEAGIDIILVGDSVGPVVLGYENTLPVTMEEVIHHSKAVVRGRQYAHVVFDMPFMSYQEGPKQGLRNAGRAIKETGCDAVKLEGGQNVADVIRAISRMDIQVMAHIGLTPQSIHRMGGFKVQGRDEAQRAKLIEDAKACQEAGAYSIVLEGIPMDVGKELTKLLDIPTIGIGAGKDCDGQVLVFHDLVNSGWGRKAKFVKQFANIQKVVADAIAGFIKEVNEGKFPDDEHSYK
jgi:3-methyl-2-oxobutanoate hydroxymethyltransferase